MVNPQLAERIEGVVRECAALVDLTERDFDILKERSEVLGNWADHLVKVFYDKLFSHEGTSKVLESTPRSSLERTLKGWYLSLLKGNPDREFWLRQWFIGLIHIARGVSNAYMLSAMSLLQREFGRLCFQHFEEGEAWYIFEAFKKITDLISVLIVEGYTDLYKKAVEGMSGIKPSLIDRMAFLESQKMWEAYKNERNPLG